MLDPFAEELAARGLHRRAATRYRYIAHHVSTGIEYAAFCVRRANALEARAGAERKQRITTDFMDADFTSEGFSGHYVGQGFTNVGSIK